MAARLGNPVESPENYMNPIGEIDRVATLDVASALSDLRREKMVGSSNAEELFRSS